MDTIAAIATPAGRGGVGVIRISGALAPAICNSIIGFIPEPRYATLAYFKDETDIIDEGIVIYFPAPHSFTGEHVVEFQGHGGPVVMNYLLSCVVKHGARFAKPGEFSETAFLNNKIDLAQAESIADLIDAQSLQAAKSAMRSLKGDFSNKIREAVDKLIFTRTFIEAFIDFPEDDLRIDVSDIENIKKNIKEIIDIIYSTKDIAQQGALLRDGMKVVIAGKPNVGKSSLLNCLTGKDSAIVTNIAGTTRDVLNECICIDGVVICISDTAGLRKTENLIEKEGIKRAHIAISESDLIVFVVDASDDNISNILCEEINQYKNNPILIVVNKIDLININLHDANLYSTYFKKIDFTNIVGVVNISTKTREGLDSLKSFLKKFSGFNHGQEGVFIARQRHIEALSQALIFLKESFEILNQHGPLEIIAENLRLAQSACNQITGVFNTDDLLGEIFSTFCIGK